MIDDARREILEREVPWDDIRERRVLARIQAARRTSRGGHRTRTTVWAAASVAVALAAALLLWVMLPGRTLDGSAVTALNGLATARNMHGGSDGQAPVTRLADGSIAVLDAGARLDVEVQSEGLVRLMQASGTVRYEVSRRPERRFVVQAAAVEVEVIGTVFTVTMADDQIQVSVERGLVEVRSQGRTVELRAGDELRVPAIAPEQVDVEVEDGADSTAVSTPSSTQPRPRSRPSRHEASTPSVEALLERSDTARASGDLARAAAALRELVRAHPKDPRAYSSYFQLGKVERSRGRHEQAARAFEACYRRAPSGALSEDARAEAAVAWRDAGRDEQARSTAESYLERYPGGTHTHRMRRILERTQ